MYTCTFLCLFVYQAVCYCVCMFDNSRYLMVYMLELKINIKKELLIG